MFNVVNTVKRERKREIERGIEREGEREHAYLVG